MKVLSFVRDVRTFEMTPYKHNTSPQVYCKRSVAYYTGSGCSTDFSCTDKKP